MNILWTLFSAIISLVLVAMLGVVARSRGILEADHSKFLSKIVIDFALPAMIFVSLAEAEISGQGFIAPLILFGVELCLIGLAWGIGKRFHLSTPQLGAVVLCAAFGSSATLGYSILSMVFPNNPGIMAEAVLISEVGVGYPIFILGPILAMHFGSGQVSAKMIRSSLINFVRSPLFIALIAGMLWSLLKLPGSQHTHVGPIFDAAHIVANLVTPLALFIIGLNLRKPNFRLILIPLGIVVLLKLCLGPLIAGGAAMGFGLPDTWQDSLVIMSALPPAMLSVIFLQRYGGDAKLASVLLAGATILSVGTILLVVAVVG